MTHFFFFFVALGINWSLTNWKYSPFKLTINWPFPDKSNKILCKYLSCTQVRSTHNNKEACLIKLKNREKSEMTSLKIADKQGPQNQINGKILSIILRPKTKKCFAYFNYCSPKRRMVVWLKQEKIQDHGKNTLERKWKKEKPCY